MANRFFRAVDKLPLAGKYAIEPLTKGYIRSSPEDEKKWLAANVALFGFFIWGHGRQASVGATALTEHLDAFQAHENPSDVLFMGIDLAYAGVNAAVTARQISIAHHLNKVRGRKKVAKQRAAAKAETAVSSGISEYEPTVLYRPEPSRTPSAEYQVRKLKAMFLAFAVTIGGQHIASISRDDAESKAQARQTQECVIEAQALLASHPEDPATVQALNAEIYAFTCGVEPETIRPNQN